MYFLFIYQTAFIKVNKYNQLKTKFKQILIPILFQLQTLGQTLYFYIISISKMRTKNKKMLKWWYHIMIYDSLSFNNIFIKFEHNVLLVFFHDYLFVCLFTCTCVVSVVFVNMDCLRFLFFIFVFDFILCAN